MMRQTTVRLPKDGGWTGPRPGAAGPGLAGPFAQAAHWLGKTWKGVEGRAE